MINCHSSGIMGRSAISHFLNFSSYISALARETRCPTHQDTIYPVSPVGSVGASEHFSCSEVATGDPHPSIYPSFFSVTPRALASATPTLGFSAITNCILNHSFRFEIKKEPKLYVPSLIAQACEDYSSSSSISSSTVSSFTVSSSYSSSSSS